MFKAAGYLFVLHSLQWEVAPAQCGTHSARAGENICDKLLETSPSPKQRTVMPHRLRRFTVRLSGMKQ